jgi:hypothetical protein
MTSSLAPCEAGTIIGSIGLVRKQVFREVSN